MIREGFREADLSGLHIERIVEDLADANANGLKVYVDFNGSILYSDTDTDINEVYLKLHGITYDERLAQYEETRKSQTALRLEWVQNTVPVLVNSYMIKGREFLTESDTIAAWDDAVIKAVHGTYKGSEIRCAVEVITAMREGRSEDDINQIINEQDHSGGSAHRLQVLLDTFAPKPHKV